MKQLRHFITRDRWKKNYEGSDEDKICPTCGHKKASHYKGNGCSKPGCECKQLKNYDDFNYGENY